MMDSIGSQHLRLLLQVIFFFHSFFLVFFSHTKKLIVQVVRSRPHVFFNEEFLYCLYFGNIFFLDLKKKKIHHSICCCCSSDRRASIKHQTCLDLSRKRRSQSQYIGNKQTALWEKIVLFFRLRSSVACSKFCHDFFLVFASVTPIFIVYFFFRHRSQSPIQDVQ